MLCSGHKSSVCRVCVVLQDVRNQRKGLCSNLLLCTASLGGGSTQVARALLGQLLNRCGGSNRCALALPGDVRRGKLRHSSQLLHAAVHQGSQLAASGVQSLAGCPDSRPGGAVGCGSSCSGARCAGGLQGWRGCGVAEHQRRLLASSRPHSRGSLPREKGLGPAPGTLGASGRARGAWEGKPGRGVGVYPGWG